MVIIILFIIEIYMLSLKTKCKYDIAKIIKIDNVKDFEIKKIIRSYGTGTDPMFIKFKISIDNYNKYSLEYYDVEKEKNFYEGEIANKKIKIDNYYICCYATAGYNTENIKTLKNAKNSMIKFKFIGVLLIILIIVYVIRKINNVENSKNNLKGKKKWE